MISISKKYNHEISYVGYDVFDTKDENFHRTVGNGKKVFSKDKIASMISPLTKNFVLHEGTTQETLWEQNIIGDFVFIDGDHRVSAIKNDFEALKNSNLIIFDDYYINKKFKDFDVEQYGCNKIIDKISLNNYCISPASVELPEIRLAFYSQNENLISKIKSFFDSFAK